MSRYFWIRPSKASRWKYRDAYKGYVHNDEKSRARKTVARYLEDILEDTIDWELELLDMLGLL